jgi:hypothetical protein
VHFNASDLTGAGALMLTGFVTNAAINGCPACGDPTGSFSKATLPLIAQPFLSLPHSH